MLMMSPIYSQTSPDLPVHAEVAVGRLDTAFATLDLGMGNQSCVIRKRLQPRRKAAAAAHGSSKVGQMCGAAAWAHRCELIHVHIAAVAATTKTPSIIPVGLVKAAIVAGAHDLG